MTWAASGTTIDSGATVAGRGAGTVLTTGRGEAAAASWEAASPGGWVRTAGAGTVRAVPVSICGEESTGSSVGLVTIAAGNGPNLRSWPLETWGAASGVISSTIRGCTTWGGFTNVGTLIETNGAAHAAGLSIAVSIAGATSTRET